MTLPSEFYSSSPDHMLQQCSTCACWDLKISQSQMIGNLQGSNKSQMNKK